MITTQSTVQMWLYTHVLGYRIRLTKRVPKPGLSGGIRYTNQWILDPSDY